MSDIKMIGKIIYFGKEYTLGVDGEWRGNEDRTLHALNRFCNPRSKRAFGGFEITDIWGVPQILAVVERFPGATYELHPELLVEPDDPEARNRIY